MIITFAYDNLIIKSKPLFMGQKIKFGLYALVGVWILYSVFFSGGDNETVTEEIALPTQGLITIIDEVQTDQFKIADEQVIADTAQSLIVARYLDETIDTFTLDEARLMQTEGGGTGRRSGIARAASYGLMGYFMGRSMSSRPSPGAYVDQKTYDKVSKNAGNSMQRTAAKKTVTRPAGKSGYGGGKSTRSVGG